MWAALTNYVNLYNTIWFEKEAFLDTDFGSLTERLNMEKVMMKIIPGLTRDGAPRLHRAKTEKEFAKIGLKINKAWEAIGSLCVGDYVGLLEASEVPGAMMKLFLDVTPLIGGEDNFFGWGNGMDLDAPAGGAVAAETAEVAVTLAQLAEPRGDGNENGDQAAEEDAGDLYNFDTRPFVELGTSAGGESDDLCDGGGNEIDYESETDNTAGYDVGIGSETNHAAVNEIGIWSETNHAGANDIGIRSDTNHAAVNEIGVGSETNHAAVNEIGIRSETNHAGANEIGVGSESNHAAANEIGVGSETNYTVVSAVDTPSAARKRVQKKLSPLEKKKNRANYDKQEHVRERKRKHIEAKRALERFNADFPLLL